MNHVELVRRAIELDRPPSLPLEVVECPGIYDAYDTLDPWGVELLPGSEDFDAVQATYHWTFAEEGRNEQGERLRRDEWGCVQRVPRGEESAYQVIHSPLAADGALERYAWPRISVAEPFFRRIERAMTPFGDRFLCGYIDPGPFLVAFNLMGYDRLLLGLHDRLDEVKAVFARVVEFQAQLARRWRHAGAHMVTIIDEFAGGSGLMLHPQLWREHFKPFFRRLIEAVKKEGMYCGFCLDGDVRAVLPDFVEMGIDLLDVRQMNCMGAEEVARLCPRTCIKASVDMQTTLARGTPDEVRGEARALVERFARAPGRNGGFIALSLRWHRPSYPAENAAAALAAFNDFRRSAG